MAGKGAHQVYIRDLHPLAGVERGLPKGLLLAALAASAASSAAAFAPSTLLASLSTGDRMCKACLLVFYRGTKERNTTFLKRGGAALPWLTLPDPYTLPDTLPDP